MFWESVNLGNLPLQIDKFCPRDLHDTGIPWRILAQRSDVLVRCYHLSKIYRVNYVAKPIYWIKSLLLVFDLCPRYRRHWLLKFLFHSMIDSVNNSNKLTCSVANGAAAISLVHGCLNHK